MKRPQRRIPQPPLALSDPARRRLRGLARTHGLSEGAALTALLEVLDRLGPAHRLERALARAARESKARETVPGTKAAGTDPQGG